MKWTRSVALGAAVLASALLAARPSRAQLDTGAVDKAAARTLALEGMRLARDGRCADAIDRLERAEKLYSAPIVAVQLGECYVAPGRLVEGTELLRAVLLAEPPPRMFPELSDAYARARALIDASVPKISQLILTVGPPRAASGAMVFVDGKPVRAPLLGVARPTDPGDHVITARAAGYVPARIGVTLGPGEQRALAIQLTPHPAATIATSAARPASPHAQLAPPPREPDREPDPTLSWPFYALLGVSGTGVATGIVTAVAVAMQKEDLSQRCDGSVCPPAAADDITTAKHLAAISMASFGVAAVAIAASLIFALADDSTETSTPAAPRPRPQRALSQLTIQF